MSEEIIEGFKFLVAQSKYFQKLKDDESFLFSEIVKQDSITIQKVQEQYSDSNKIKKIRYEVANLLISKNFNYEKYLDLKNKINDKYETNILKSWKDYSILYVFFFNPIKDKVNRYLEDIGSYFLSQSNLALNLKTSNFDGGQNFGDVGCWIAFYNPKHKSQSVGVQYFINFYQGSSNYGTYKHQTKEYIQTNQYDINNFGEDDILKILNDLDEQSHLIFENDMSTQKGNKMKL